MSMESSSLKAYVAVDVHFDIEGQIKPLRVTWEDGRVYEIDAVLDVRQAASLKAGGAGIRYKVRIGRHVTFLFFEETRWFVERRTAS